MSNTLPNEDFRSQIDQAILSLVKEKFEFFMREEMKNFLNVEHPDEGNSKNGYYQRVMDTKHGRINELNVPRDRQGQYHTNLFEPYQRRDGWLENAIIEMYQQGMSTRDVGKFVENILGKSYSATTISNITDVLVEDIEAWKNRPLAKRYSVLFLDGMYFKLRRTYVASEAIYLVVGITEEGSREILGFYVGGQESSFGWREVLEDLYNRGAKEVLLGVFDGLSGLSDAFHDVYPKADVQRCVIHKVRNTLNKVRKKDQYEVAEDLKDVYKSRTYKLAEEMFENFRDKWRQQYPNEVKSWEKDLGELLTFLRYPEDIRKVIYTTNWIERTIKEFRKRIRPMNSISTLEAAEKIVYLKIQHINDFWSERRIQGFLKSKPILKEMFQERYSSSFTQTS